MILNHTSAPKKKKINQEGQMPDHYVNIKKTVLPSLDDKTKEQSNK